MAKRSHFRMDATAFSKPQPQGKKHLRGLRKIKRVSLTQQEIFKKYCDVSTKLHKLQSQCATIARLLMSAIDESRKAV